MRVAISNAFLDDNWCFKWTWNGSATFINSAPRVISGAESSSGSVDCVIVAVLWPEPSSHPFHQNAFLLEKTSELGSIRPDIMLDSSVRRCRTFSRPVYFCAWATDPCCVSTDLLQGKESNNSLSFDYSTNGHPLIQDLTILVTNAGIGASFLPLGHSVVFFSYRNAVVGYIRRFQMHWTHVLCQQCVLLTCHPDLHSTLVPSFPNFRSLVVLWLKITVRQSAIHRSTHTHPQPVHRAEIAVIHFCSSFL